MGLSISRTIVEAHGGRLWATSDVNDGTVFHFTLPLSEGSSHDDV
jgi:signal transduction histidine kinase